MKKIQKKLSKTIGYLPTNQEIFNWYRNGELELTDKEEKEILKFINN